MKKALLVFVLMLLITPIVSLPNNAKAAVADPKVSVELKNYLGSQQSIQVKVTGKYKVAMNSRNCSFI